MKKVFVEKVLYPFIREINSDVRELKYSEDDFGEYITIVFAKGRKIIDVTCNSDAATAIAVIRSVM